MPTSAKATDQPGNRWCPFLLRLPESAGGGKPLPPPISGAMAAAVLPVIFALASAHNAG
jgi:hypothetical protein